MGSDGISQISHFRHAWLCLLDNLDISQLPTFGGGSVVTSFQGGLSAASMAFAALAATGTTAVKFFQNVFVLIQVHNVDKWFLMFLYILRLQLNGPAFFFADKPDLLVLGMKSHKTLHRND